MLQNIKQLDEGLKTLVAKELENIHLLDIFVVSNVDYDEYRANIKQLNSSLEYKDVDISSIMLGNGKGLLIPPSVNDLVLVGFLNGHMNSPIIIGSIFNRNMIEPDSILDIREDEVFLGNKVNGSYFFIDEDNNIKLKLASSGSIYLDDLKMPATSGLSGQVLSSDGAGNAVWVGTGSGGYYNFNSPLSVDTLNVYLNLHSNGKLKVSTDAIPDLNTLQLDDTKIDHLDKTLNTGLVTVTTGTGLIGSTPNNTGDWDDAYGWGDHAGLYDAVGTASSEVGTHESTYDHTLIATALQSESDPEFAAWLLATPPLYPGGWYDAEQNTIALSDFDDDLSYESPLTFSFPLSRTADTISLDYNTTNLKITTNQLNTIQDISTTSSPSFTNISSSNNATANSHLVRLDQMNSIIAALNWQKSILEQLNFVTSEPSSPTIGDRYINTATGDSSETTQAVTATYIYEWNGEDWTEYIPVEGWTVWDVDGDTNYTFNGTIWVEFGSTVSHNNTTGLQGGTTSEYYHMTSAEHGNISDWNTAYGWGDHAGLYDTVGTASSEVGAHELAYDHTLIATAIQTETDPEFAAWLLATPPLYPGGWYDAVQNTIALSGFDDDLSYEVPLTFSTGLTRTDNTITCDITQYTDSDAIAAIQGDASWNASDWDTAYGWGDHAGLYLKLDQTTPEELITKEYIVEEVDVKNYFKFESAEGHDGYFFPYLRGYTYFDGFGEVENLMIDSTHLLLKNNGTSTYNDIKFLIHGSSDFYSFGYSTVTTSFVIGSSLLPNVDDTHDLGSSSLRWNDIYLSGNLTNGTQNISVLEAANAYSWGDHAGLYDTTGTAQGVMDTHELTYDHTLIATALQNETDPDFNAWLLATPPLYPGGWYDTLQSSIDISGFNNDSGFITGVAWDEITGDQTDISLSGFTDDLSYEVPLTFSTGLTRTDNTITCDITQYTDSDAIDAIQGDASWNATDWDTAYGWGNHADGGYLTSLAGAVLTDQTTPQTIGDTTNRLAKLWASDLVVDNINLNGSTITGVSDANTVITAYAGRAIAIEGVSFDGGAVTGVTTLSMNNQLTSTLATGTRPLNVTSTTVCTNLNADKLDGADLSTTTTLGTSDVLVPSQNAVKTYVDAVGFPQMVALRQAGGNQALNNTTWAEITFDTEIYDTDTMHDASSNTNRITFTTAGTYEVSAGISVGARAGEWFGRIQLNGSDIWNGIVMGSTGWYASFNVSLTRAFTAGQYISFGIYNNTGGNSATIGIYNTFSAKRVK